MNDKEKKAIKRCYRRINELKLNFAITNEDLNAIETVLNILEKKDKIIDLMANNLIGVVFSDNDNKEILFDNKEDVKKYFENKEEESK